MTGSFHHRKIQVKSNSVGKPTKDSILEKRKEERKLQKRLKRMVRNGSKKKAKPYYSKHLATAWERKGKSKQYIYAEIKVLSDKISKGLKEKTFNQLSESLSLNQKLRSKNAQLRIVHRIIDKKIGKKVGDRTSDNFNRICRRSLFRQGIKNCNRQLLTIFVDKKQEQR